MATSSRPFSETHWGRIVNVGWAVGGVVRVEVTAPETKLYSVLSLAPPDTGTDFFGGATINEDDYKEHFVLRVGDTGNLGSVVVEDAIDDIWAWDDWLGQEPIGSDPDGVAEQIALKSAFAGYGPNLHFAGHGVKTNPLSLPATPPVLGDIKNHTFPNGSSISYRSDYTLVTNDGGFNYLNMETWYWHRVRSRPESRAAILRSSYLVNFRRGFVQSAELRDFASGLDEPLSWVIAGYPAGTGFHASLGQLTPIGGVLPKFSASGSAAGGHEGTIRRFGGTGFIA